MLTTVAYYRIPRNDADGEAVASIHYDRLFVMALRWAPEIGVIPDDMVSAASKRKGEAEHVGLSALRVLHNGGDINGHQLTGAYRYLEAALAYYETVEEPVPGRNAEAIGDLLDLFNELRVSV